MDEIKSVAELIRHFELSRVHFENHIANIDPAQLVVSGVCGNWSIKDILAHTVVWENRMQEWLVQIIEKGEIPGFLNAEQNNETLNALNEETYLAYKDTSLDEVMRLFQENHQHVLEFLNTLPNDLLFDAKTNRFGESHPMWHLVAANTFWHYAEHLAQIEEFTREE